MEKTHTVSVGEVVFSNTSRLNIIAGPCVMESLGHALDIAGKLCELSQELDFGLIYKTSYDKANRTSLDSHRGPGVETAIPIFSEIKKQCGCPVLTDIHSVEDAKALAEVTDVLQIPAFLCRQTDLLRAAGETGKVINIKKGQFLAPWDMGNVAEKVEKTGNKNIFLCERGTSFGYNNLVSDMRSLPILRKLGYPVIFDATHSVQQPGGLGSSSGGQREFAPVLAKAAVAVGVAGVFMETHQDPDNAPSDGPNMIKITEMRDLISLLLEIDIVTKRSMGDM